MPSFDRPFVVLRAALAGDALAQLATAAVFATAMALRAGADPELGLAVVCAVLGATLTAAGARRRGLPTDAWADLPERARVTSPWRWIGRTALATLALTIAAGAVLAWSTGSPEAVIAAAATAVGGAAASALAALRVSAWERRHGREAIIAERWGEPDAGGLRFVRAPRRDDA